MLFQILKYDWKFKWRIDLKVSESIQIIKYISAYLVLNCSSYEKQN